MNHLLLGCVQPKLAKSNLENKYVDLWRPPLGSRPHSTFDLIWDLFKFEIETNSLEFPSNLFPKLPLYCYGVPCCGMLPFALQGLSLQGRCCSGPSWGLCVQPSCTKHIYYSIYFQLTCLWASRLFSFGLELWALNPLRFAAWAIFPPSKGEEPPRFQIREWYMLNNTPLKWQFTWN